MKDKPQETMNPEPTPIQPAKPGAKKGSKHAAKWSEPTVKVSLCLPISIHAELVARAERQDISPAVLVAGLIAAKPAREAHEYQRNADTTNPMLGRLDQ